MTSTDSVPIKSPAERLNDLLQDAASTRFAGLNTSHVVCALVGRVPPKQLGEAYLAFAEIMALVEMAQVDAETTIPGFVGSPFEQVFVTIRQILSDARMEPSWDSYRNPLQQIITYGMPFVVFEIGKFRTAATASGKELASLRGAVDELRESLIAADIPPHDKADMLRHLSQLHDRLTRLSVFGQEGIAETTAALVADTVRLQSSPNAAATVEKGLKLAQLVEDVVLKGYTTIQLVAPAILKLLSK
jgi:hypothetical protein